jgi:hypothetical protein
MMPWAVLGLVLAFLVVSYVVVQGTRAALAWRRAAEAGDLAVIRDIVEDALSVWRSMRRPKSVPVDVWRGVQSMQLNGVDADLVWVSCQAQSEYRPAGDRWVEVADPLQSGFEITACAADMLFYELPHFRPGRIQVDIYTSFREGDGTTSHVCILSTPATREAARDVDWDEWPASRIVDALGGRYRLGERGQPLGIQPDIPVEPNAGPSSAAAGGSQAAISP